MLQQETAQLNAELEALWKQKCELEASVEAQREQVEAAEAIKQDSMECLAAYEQEAAKAVSLELDLDASYDALKNLAAAGLIETVARLHRQPLLLLRQAAVVRWQARASAFFEGLQQGVVLGEEPAKPWRQGNHSQVTATRREPPGAAVR